MAMRMPPQVAQQPVLPDVNRTSLVLFAGLALIVLNLFWINGPSFVNAIFRPGAAYYPFTKLSDTGWQVLGVALLTLLAQYGGENAGTAALWFLGALWLLWLVVHMGTKPAASETASTGTASSTGTSSSATPTQQSNPVPPHTPF